ncbi:MAG: GatB/YqeY domain-containing protein [Bacteroidota bacterium]
MSLKTKIDGDIKTAMRAKEKDRLRTLRSIKSLIMLEETKEGAGEGISEAEEIKLLSKAAKQRKEAAEVYQNQDRPELAQKELDELAVIEEYLPKQLSEEELKEKLQAIIQEVGASAPSDMGKVMGRASKELAGQADGKAISQMVKSLLNS